MPELALWPLLPFLGLWARHAGFWTGVAAGGAGILWSLFFRGAGLGPCLAGAAAWLASSFFMARRGLTWHMDRARDRASLEDLKKQATVLEREHAATREEFEKYHKEETSAFLIYSLAKSLNDSVSWDALLARFSSVLQKVTGSSEFLVYLASAMSGELELQLKQGPWDENALPRVPPQRHPQWLEGNLLQAPLWQGEEMVGLLYIRWPQGPRPSTTDVEHLFENLLTGFQKARLFARMEAMSRLDGLTGVMRRQTFMDKLDAEWRRAGGFKTTFCYMLVDVDHFKRINDTYGHQAGDAVLARLGAILRASFYETDSVGRYGGEEFGVLLPRAEPEGVKRKAERLRATVEAETFSVGVENLRLTVSIGMGHFPRDGRTVSEVVEAADRALYAAKEGGRNRIVDAADVR